MRLLTALLITAVTTTAAIAAPPYKAPTNRLGQPDFEGVWSMNSMTRLERPRTIANLVLTPEQIAVLDSFMGQVSGAAHDQRAAG